ncbi:MAG: trypsin-like peptidase domain-containing protein [Candidatus Sulfotelmatobacter sp.]
MAAVPLLLAAISAQNVPSTNKGLHLDIPAISRKANGSVVSIVMSDKDGHPIAQGSGFLVSKDGRVVTNYHVIKNGTSAIVKLPNGSFFLVDGVLASDKDRDVAIIKAHGNDFRTLALGDSDRLQVGEEVVAIGSPLSLESTISNGIVSGIRSDEGRKLLQITTPISHGSSGGPLFNLAGEVVGITTAALVGGENLNFAIPINDVKPMLVSRASQVHSLPDEAEPVTTEPTTGGSPTRERCKADYGVWSYQTEDRSKFNVFGGYKGTAHVIEVEAEEMFMCSNVYQTNEQGLSLDGHNGSFLSLSVLLYKDVTERRIYFLARYGLEENYDKVWNGYKEKMLQEHANDPQFNELIIMLLIQPTFAKAYLDKSDLAEQFYKEDEAGERGYYGPKNRPCGHPVCTTRDYEPQKRSNPENNPETKSAVVWSPNGGGNGDGWWSGWSIEPITGKRVRELSLRDPSNKVLLSVRFNNNTPALVTHWSTVDQIVTVVFTVTNNTDSPLVLHGSTFQTSWSLLNDKQLRNSFKWHNKSDATDFYERSVVTIQPAQAGDIWFPVVRDVAGRGVGDDGTLAGGDHSRFSIRVAGRDLVFPVDDFRQLY